jgi:hypothetical protein
MNNENEILDYIAENEILDYIALMIHTAAGYKGPRIG